MMRRRSKKTEARADELRQFRDELIFEVGHCEICSTRQMRMLVVHHIARGAHRHKADHPFCVLVLCTYCHNWIHTVSDWPESKQLAVLRRSRPEDFDLAAYNELIGYGPNRISKEDVDEWEEEPS